MPDYVDPASAKKGADAARNATGIGPAPPPSRASAMLEWLTGYPADPTREVNPLEVLAAVPVLRGLKGLRGATKLDELADAALDLSRAAREGRAAEQGFTTEAYRGAKRYNEDPGVPAWFTTDVDEANAYSGSVNPTAKLFGEANVPVPPFQRGSQVQPVKLRVQRPKPVSFTEAAFPTPESLAKAKAEGYDALAYVREGKTWYVPLDRAQVRSRFAAFDPKKIGSRDLVAGVGFGLGAGAATQRDALLQQLQGDGAQ